MTSKPNLRLPPLEIQRVLDDHRRWLESSGQKGVRIGSHCEPIDLQELNLDGVDLSLAFMSGAEFQNSSLRGAWFIGAQLDGAVFVDCDLTGGARFDGANLSVANFIGADYRGASFDGAETKHTIWTVEDALAYRASADAHIKTVLERGISTANSGHGLDGDWDDSCEDEPSVPSREEFAFWSRARRKLNDFLL